MPIKKFHLQHVLDELGLSHEEKYPLPENWLYKEARELFKTPDVTDGDKLEIKWNDPDEEGLIKFLCGDKAFSEDRVRNGVKKLAKEVHREDGIVFLKVLPSNGPTKRKSEENYAGKKKKATRGKGQYKRGK